MNMLVNGLLLGYLPILFVLYAMDRRITTLHEALKAQVDINTQVIVMLKMLARESGNDSFR